MQQDKEEGHAGEAIVRDGGGRGGGDIKVIENRANHKNVRRVGGGGGGWGGGVLSSPKRAKGKNLRRIWRKLRSQEGKMVLRQEGCEREHTK